MNGVSLSSLAEEHLAKAADTAAGRSSHTLHGGRDHALRQTLIALVAGQRLGDHESPGEATVQVLRGTVRVHADGDTWEGGPGDYALIPPARHDLEAVEDSVVLLTVSVHGVPGT
ncbi:cupin domain-containing protein [Nocardioides sp. KR10-350]|uniref:cupin domain-containing protein n=1 Tax=Nocardioides cheoyonin TaxID=3156615 RepID=UPI0032B5B19E